MSQQAIQATATPVKEAAQQATFFTHGQTTRTFSGLSPYQVLGKLPKDATEQQRDSAIRAEFRAGKTQYNQRVDTLKGFGVQVKESKRLSEMDYRDLDIIYTRDTSSHVTLSLGSQGVLGEPAPYAISTDDTISCLLLGGFVITMLAVSYSWQFLLRQVKNFFYVPRSVADMQETSGEIHFLRFLVLMTALFLAILDYFYARVYMPGEFVFDSQVLVIGILFVINSVYFLFKGAAYGIVNWVFFYDKNNGQWRRVSLFLVSMEGVLLFPIVLLQVYFDIPYETTLTYTLIVIFFVKILTFYKTFTIFFKRTGLFLQNILYFCALELIPMVALVGILMITGNYLKINF